MAWLRHVVNVTHYTADAAVPDKCNCSYLPYWKTVKGQWALVEIVPRSGDGAKPMPDRVNAYSHAEIIENTSEAVIVHWRYLASFTAGNPHGQLSPINSVEELFASTPGGRVERVVRRGTEKTDD